MGLGTDLNEMVYFSVQMVYSPIYLTESGRDGAIRQPTSSSTSYPKIITNGDIHVAHDAPDVG